jgi:hypothetical protein
LLLDCRIDSVASGLAIGLMASAYTPRRDGLEHATRTFRAFREEPTPELARTATGGGHGRAVAELRLQRLYLPCATYPVVPLFGRANAGVRLDCGTVHQAVESSISWGIFLTLLIGKPLGQSVVQRPSGQATASTEWGGAGIERPACLFALRSGRGPAATCYGPQRAAHQTGQRSGGVQQLAW